MRGLFAFVKKFFYRILKCWRNFNFSCFFLICFNLLDGGIESQLFWHTVFICCLIETLITLIGILKIVLFAVLSLVSYRLGSLGI